MKTACVGLKFDMHAEFEFAKEHFGLESFKYKDLAKLTNAVYVKTFNRHVQKYSDLYKNLPQPLNDKEREEVTQIVETLSDKVVFYMTLSWILNNKLTPKDCY